MSLRAWATILICLTLSLAGCRPAEQQPEPEPESQQQGELPEDVDGQKVFDALSSSLKTAASDAVTNPPSPEPSPGGEP